MTNAVVRFAVLFGFLCSPGLLLAHDASMPHHEWYNKQEMNPAARERIGVPWKSCCENGDVFKTRFRIAAIGRISGRFQEWRVENHSARHHKKRRYP